MEKDATLITFESRIVLRFVKTQIAREFEGSIAKIAFVVLFYFTVQPNLMVAKAALVFKFSSAFRTFLCFFHVSSTVICVRF